MADENKEKKAWELAVYDEKVKNSFIKIVDEKKWLSEAIFAYQIVKGNDTLQKCDPESIRKAIMNVALTGATLNPVLQEAFLVPRKSKCCLDFGYRGLIGIACSKGPIKYMEAQVVYTWDEFDYEQGTNQRLHYKMNLEPPENMDKIATDPKAIWDHVLCAFSRAVLIDGSENFIILPRYKLLKIAKSSEAFGHKDMPWQKWPEEQMRKTVVKYHSKTLPKQGNDQLALAVALLNEHEGLKKEPTSAEILQQRFGVSPGKMALDELKTEEAQVATAEEKSPETTKTHENEDKTEATSPFPAVLIKNWIKTEGRDKNGKPYTLYEIIDENDIKYLTFSKSIAIAAEKAREAGRKCTIVSHETQYGNVIDELREVAQ